MGRKYGKGKYWRSGIKENVVTETEEALPLLFYQLRGTSVHSNSTWQIGEKSEHGQKSKNDFEISGPGKWDRQAIIKTRC